MWMIPKCVDLDIIVGNKCNKKISYPISQQITSFDEID